jgi:flagellar biosynthesis/type III secretory pathway chaperone
MAMEGKQLSELIDHRLSILRKLLEISNRQMAAIDAGRMSDLMRLLSEKQMPLNRLAEIAARIRVAAADDPAARLWGSEQARIRCRERQEECEKIHLQLLAVEAECEAALGRSRASIGQQLDRVDATRQAASSYGHGATAPTRGGQLDLSSD